jgi:hypothetical protein
MTSSSLHLRRYFPSPIFLPHLPSLPRPKLTHSPKQSVKRFYLPHHPWVRYRPLDKTIATEFSRYLIEQKQEKRQQHQREKRKARKVALRQEKGTEQERQGALEAGGKDCRKGGKKYKKDDDDDEEKDAGAGAAEEEVETGLEELAIGEVEGKVTQDVEIGEVKRVGKKEPKQKEEARKKEEAQRKQEVKKRGVWDTPWKNKSGVDEIRKPNWFFSGEDSLKHG